MTWSDKFSETFGAAFLGSDRTFREKGKTFSVRERGEQIVFFIRVDGGLVDADSDQPRCDGLVLVRNERNEDRFEHLFVELKGEDLAHAIDQIVNTKRLFCKRSGDALHQRFEHSGIRHSREGVFGMIVSKGSLIPSHQIKRKQAKMRDGVTILKRNSSDVTGMSVQDLKCDLGL